MFRGYYISANGMINQQRILDTISNNVANAHTAGYKSDKNIPDTFARQLILINGKKNKTGTIEYRTFDKTHTDLTEGTFEFTRSRLDVAIKGNATFNIQPYGEHDEEKVYLTRNGQFNIDDEGYLALGSSGRIISEEGPISLGTADFTISNDGVITTEDGRTFHLKLSQVLDDDVHKEGDNMFSAENIDDAQVGQFEIIQGAYERSNVDVGKQSIDAIEAQRIFEACSQALKNMNTINEKAATQIGNLN